MALGISFSRVLVHVVWATKGRVYILREARDSWLETVLAQQADAVGAKLLSSGTAPDHVHALVDLGRRSSLASLAQRLKGGSAHAWNSADAAVPVLQWQDGYWAESIGVDRLDAMRVYLSNQREAHRRRSLLEAWERSDRSRCAAPT